jgi:hypothetical protein
MAKAKYTDEAVDKIYRMGFVHGFKLGKTNPENLNGNDARVQQEAVNKRANDFKKLRETDAQGAGR